MIITLYSSSERKWSAGHTVPAAVPELRAHPCFPLIVPLPSQLPPPKPPHISEGRRIAVGHDESIAMRAED
jgi:hypothetical protein